MQMKLEDFKLERNILNNSLFYYCCGKDPTPVAAFGAKFPLYVYSDLLNYGRGNFTQETQTLYLRLKNLNFTFLGARSFLINENRAELTLWKSLQNEEFFILYVAGDAVKTYTQIYGLNVAYTHPKCVCNMRYEMNASFFSKVENATDYIMGYCFNKEFAPLTTYPYLGDYGKEKSVTLHGKYPLF